jgi:hypothetical protein
MNADSALSGVVAYFLNEGNTVVGNGKAPGMSGRLHVVAGTLVWIVSVLWCFTFFALVLFDSANRDKWMLP